MDIGWQIVDICIVGIIFKPSFIIWVIACCTARRRSDAARTSFSWMKAAFPGLMVWIFFSVASNAIAAVSTSLANDVTYDYYTDSYSTVDGNTILTLNNVSNRLFTVSLLFQYITNALTVICLVELGLGFLYVLGNGRSRAHTMMRSGIFVVGALLVILTAAQIGLYNASYTMLYNYQISNSNGTATDGGLLVGDNFDLNTYEEKFTAANGLEMATDSILLVVSIALIGFASYCLHQVEKRAPFIQHSCVLFLVATILQFIRAVWSVVYDAAWILPAGAIVPEVVPAVVDPVLNEWSLFVLLTLVFVIGRRKLGGLWTTQQPWNQGGVAPPMMPQQQEQHQGQWGQAAPMVYQQPVYGAPPQSGWQQQPQQVAPQDWRNSQTQGSPPPSGATYYQPPANGGYPHEMK